MEVTFYVAPSNKDMGDGGTLSGQIPLKIKLWDLIRLPHFTKNATSGMRPKSRVRQPLHGGEHGDHGQGQQSPVYAELIN